RHLDPQIVAFAFEPRIRRNVDRDQRITNAARAGYALLFQPNLLAIANADRKRDLDFLARRQPYPKLCAPRNIRQRGRHGPSNVLSRSLTREALALELRT